LIAEDEYAVRKLTRTALQQYGYTVLDADNGDAALSLCEQHEGPIDLLLTDVIMPGMSGRELAECLEQRHPGTKILYMSGHTHDVIGHHGVLDPSVAFIQKPFTPSVLARVVRDVLDNRPLPERSLASQVQ
jgi:CheY-like chemotaxis protein